MADVIVVFPNKDNAINIRNILTRGGCEVIGVCTTGAQVLHYTELLDEGIVVCGYKLADMLYTELREYLPKEFEMLLVASPEKWQGDFDSVTDAIKKHHTDGRDCYLVVVAEGVTDAEELAKLIQEKTGIESRVSVLGYIQRGGQPSAKDRMYGSLMGAYAVEILKESRKNRVVAIKNDLLVDYDLEEALSLKNNSLDSFQYQLSLRLSE